MEVAAMLCQFTVKNYKSIRDEITFDMQATAISEHDNKIIKDIDDELFFRTAKAEYRYILHVKEDEVIYESLDRVKMDTGRRSALFRRDTESTELKRIFGKEK